MEDKWGVFQVNLLNMQLRANSQEPECLHRRYCVANTRRGLGHDNNGASLYTTAGQKEAVLMLTLHLSWTVHYPALQL